MRHDDDVLGGLRAPTAPSSLRERVLDAACRAGDEAEDAWTRALRSRSVRFAWAASVAVLALLHAALSLRESRPANGGASSGVDARADAELAEVLSLPRARAIPGGDDDAGNSIEEEIP